VKRDELQRRLLGGRREELRQLAQRSRELVLLSAGVGVVTGLGVAAFERVVDHVLLERVMDLPVALLAVTPLLGLVLAAAARRFLGGAEVDPATTDEYLRAFHDPGHHLGLRALAARITAALATLGSGGPMGMEGPSLYLGASLGSAVQRRWPKLLRKADHRTLLLAGAAAGVAAIFKAPATGAVFALEVPFRDDLARRMLLPSLVSAASGYLAFVAVNGTTPLFEAQGDPAFNLRDLLGAVVLGVVAGVGARLFALAVRGAKVWAVRPITVRLVAAGPVLVGAYLLGRLLTGEDLVLGSGYELVHWASDTDRGVWVLLGLLVLRSLATAATVAGAGVGGLFVPLVAAGALVGRIVGQSVHSLDTSLFTVVGVAAFLGAGYRVPLAAVMFVAETTGRPGFVVPGLLAAVAAELMMGRASITTFQVPANR